MENLYLTGGAWYGMIDTMGEAWHAVKKVFRNHNSYTVCLPMMLRRALKIRPGTYLEFKYRPGAESFRVKVIKFGGKNAK